MKVLIFILAIYWSVDMQAQIQERALIVLNERQYDFGDVFEGEKKEHVFEIENSGNKPLILANILTSCGCTATTWPRNPVNPGEKADIIVIFNSTGKMGNQKKIITILSNSANEREELEITAHVIPRKSDY
jgi:hypothetical protein